MSAPLPPPKDRKESPSRALISPEERRRRVIIFEGDFDPLRDDGALKAWAYYSDATERQRHDVMAEILGWSAGAWGSQKIKHAYVWQALVKEMQRFKAQYVYDWSCRVPTFRLVKVKVDSALQDANVGKESPVRQDNQWTGHDVALYNWEAEDYYARFILRLMDALHSKDFKALVKWIRDAAPEEQVYIFFNLLQLFLYEEKAGLWYKLPVYRRLRLCLTGRGKNIY